MCVAIVCHILFVDISETECDEGDVRLVSQLQRGQGIVQVCFNNSWSSLCHSGTQFDVNEGRVVCNQLGFQSSQGSRSKFYKASKNLLMYMGKLIKRESIDCESYNEEKQRKEAGSFTIP